MEPTRLLFPWGFSSKNSALGCHVLLQRIFPTQGSNLGLPQCGQILYWRSHQGSPRILEWVAYHFSRGPSWPRNQTGVSDTAGKFFNSWATNSMSSKESACNVEDPGLIPWSGRSHGEENGNPLQYSCLGNLMDIGVWRAATMVLQESDTK